MGGVDGIEKGVNALIVVGVGVFMLLLFLALDYSSYAQTRNNLVTQYGSGAGVVANFTTNGGNITTTFGNNIPLAVFALIFIAIIAAVVYVLRGSRIAEGGSFLG